MKKVISIQFCVVFLCTLLIGTMSYAQNISPQSINSGGGIMSHVSGSLSLTVGELLVLPLIDSVGNTLNGGFTAGISLTAVSIQDADAIELDAQVYPNPTKNFINIRINHSTLDQVVVTISDFQGKDVYSGKYAGISNVIGINTASYATGNYLLTLKKVNNQVLGIFKIIKQ